MGVRSSVDVVYSWSFQGRPWLCKVAERQMLRPSFVPPPPIRILRDLTRTGLTWSRPAPPRSSGWRSCRRTSRSSCQSWPPTSIGVFGRDMMAALIGGQRDPKVRAQMARARMLAKIPQLVEAFGGRFSDHHGFRLTPMLARIDALTIDIDAVQERTEPRTGPFRPAGGPPR